MRKFIRLFSYCHAVDNFTSSDIRKRTLIDYQLVNKKRNAGKEAFRVHFGFKVHLNPTWGGEKEDEKEEMLGKNEIDASRWSTHTHCYLGLAASAGTGKGILAFIHMQTELFEKLCYKWLAGYTRRLHYALSTGKRMLHRSAKS